MMNKKRIIALGLCAMSLFILIPQDSMAYLQQPSQTFNVFNGHLSYDIKNKPKLNTENENTSTTVVPSNDVIVQPPTVNNNLNGESTKPTPVDPDKNEKPEETPKEDSTVDVTKPENNNPTTETPVEPTPPVEPTNPDSSLEDSSSNTTDPNIEVQN